MYQNPHQVNAPLPDELAPLVSTALAYMVLVDPLAEERNSISVATTRFESASNVA
jgi:hypothetical protein